VWGGGARPPPPNPQSPIPNPQSPILILCYKFCKKLQFEIN